MEPETLLTLKQAARLAGVTPRALRKRSATGSLSATERIVGGRCVLVVAFEELKRLYPRVARSAEPEEPVGEPARPAHGVLVPRAPPAESSAERQPAPQGGGVGDANARTVAAIEAELAAAREHAAFLRERFDAELARAAAAERTVAELQERAFAAELERERLRGSLSMAERVEQSAQRAADKLELRLDAARREALSLSRMLGQVQGEAAQLRAQLEAPRGFLRRFRGR